MDNGESHFEITGPEIYKQTNGEFDTFLASVELVVLFPDVLDI
ncbi:MAG: hypothetical protein CM15mP107_2410 [Bacteroidota bacterium]|nr:MAG: hypothetical protein CM15mP107_2410 [Bacteroidota bacterium]